jgi:DNA-binding CsgD family transcriptional regulator/PAS domain-containing protein
MSEGSPRTVDDPVLAVASLLRAHPATESLTALARLLESSPNCIIITGVSADFNCSYLNRAARRRFRKKMDELTGRPLREILPGGGRDEFLCALRIAVGSMKAIHRRFSEEESVRGGVSDSGELLIKNWRIYPISDRRGVVKHLMLGERMHSPAAVHGFTDARRRGSVWHARSETSTLSKPGAREGKTQPALTNREWQVAELVALGLTNRSIAQRLFLSRPTVASHVARILGKLSLASRVQLATWVARQRTFNQV